MPRAIGVVALVVEVNQGRTLVFGNTGRKVASCIIHASTKQQQHRQQLKGELWGTILFALSNKKKKQPFDRIPHKRL